MLTSLIEHIFIIHYTPLIERKNRIVSYFNENNIRNYEFRNLYQRENLTEELKEKYNANKIMNNAHICITIEHIETYVKIIETCTDQNKWFLILEDDAIFCTDFINKLNFYMENIPDDAEYLDINDFYKTNSDILWEKNMYTRTTCSYLIKKTTCEKLLSSIIPFNNSIDNELNTQFVKHNINNYWSNDSLIHHGSSSIYKPSHS